MAKYTSSGFIQQIRGSVGNSTFSYWKGIPRISKKAKKGRRTNTESQKRIMETFVKIWTDWKKLSLQEWAMWEHYAKRHTKMRTKKRNGLVTAIGGKMSGLNAYMGINQLLIGCGFEPIRRPTLKIETKPPIPLTDLINLGAYKNEISFKVWLPYSYNTKCVAQIWVKKMQMGAYPYITDIVQLSNEPSQVIIDKIRLKQGEQIDHKLFKEIENSRLRIQMRTVAQNGEFSIPTAIYTVEVIN